MVRRYSWVALVAVLVLGAAPLRASSIAPLQGQFVGIELCEQAVCGAAYFTGIFNGLVGFNYSIGSITVAVKHDPLPPPNTSGNVTGGQWQLKTFSGKTLSGGITDGTLFNNNNGTFHVVIHMSVSTGGSATFEGTLSHNTFPPTIWGSITP